MAWLFAGVLALLLGVAIEGYARQSPARRPSNPAANALLYYLAKGAGLLVLVAFIWSFFLFSWWAVAGIFVGAFVANVMIYSRIRASGAAPGISMLLLLIGVPLTMTALLISPLS